MASDIEEENIIDFLSGAVSPPALPSANSKGTVATDVAGKDGRSAGPPPQPQQHQMSPPASKNPQAPAPTLPLKPKSKISIKVDIPSTHSFNNDVKILPTLSTKALLEKLIKKKILPASTSPSSSLLAWKIIHVPQKDPIDSHEFSPTDAEVPLWELGLRDKVFV
jgi:hypothetical protein